MATPCTINRAEAGSDAWEEFADGAVKAPEEGTEAIVNRRSRGLLIFLRHRPSSDGFADLVGGFYGGGVICLAVGPGAGRRRGT